MLERKILIVDDEPMMRMLVTDYLGQAGYQVIEAANGEEGLDQFRKHQPQVIITDLAMPVMDGLELLKRLPLENQLIHAIVLTGCSDDLNIEDCFHLGIRSFLRKPVNLYELMGLVKCAFKLVNNALLLKDQVEEAQKTTNLLTHTFDAMAEGVLILDNLFQIRFGSGKACQIMDLDEMTILGKSAAVVIGSEIAGVDGHLSVCAGTGSRKTGIKTRIYCQTGAIIPVSLAITPIGKGKITGWLLLFRDDRAEERLSLEESRLVAYGSIVGCDPKMMRLYDMIDRLAISGANVLVQGESGTGKELVARELHRRGRRAQRPFIAINCAAIPANLMESEFFGHERGAFTGAVTARKGRFELAHGGTLFLDEIAELPLDFQGKLLRVLQERCFERVGGSQQISVDIRIIAATNRHLREMVNQNLFREDLYYRLNVVPLTLPPLRDRAQDIPLLVNHFIKSLNEREKRQVEQLSKEGHQRLLEHDWPGNVRELQNTLEHAFALSSGSTLGQEHLPDLFSNDLAEARSVRELTQRALVQTGFNLAKAASLLGVNRSTLYRRQKKFGLLNLE